MDPKFQHEFRAVRALVKHLDFTVRDEQPIEKLRTGAKPTPDFRVHMADGSCFAVEVARLTEPKVARHSAFRVACYDGMRAAISVAQSPVRAAFWVWGEPPLRDARKFGDVATGLVARLGSTPGASLSDDVRSGDGVAGRVEVTRLLPEQDSWFDDAEIGQFAGTRAEIVRSRIQKKEEKLPFYRAQHAVVFLLLVTGAEPGQIAVGEWVASEKYAYAFDRAFVLDEQGVGMRELPRI